MPAPRPVDQLMSLLSKRQEKPAFLAQEIRQAMLADPSLFDSFLHRDFSLFGSSAMAVQVAWDLVVQHDPQKAGQILPVMARAQLGVRPAIASTQLLHDPIRRAWLDLLERRESTERMRSLVGMTVDLLENYLDGKADDDQQSICLEFIVRELTDPITPESRKVGMAGRVLATMRSDMTRLAQEGARTRRAQPTLASLNLSPPFQHDNDQVAQYEWRAKRVLTILMTLGLEINKPRTRVYPNPRKKNGSKTTVRHPNLIHELLWMAQRRDLCCRLSACVADVGGHWKDAWDDPSLAEVARQSLGRSHAVMRDRLTLLANPQERPNGEGRAI